MILNCTAKEMILYYAAFSVFMLSFCLSNVYFFNKPEFEIVCIDAEIQFLLCLHAQQECLKICNIYCEITELNNLSIQTFLGMLHFIKRKKICFSFFFQYLAIFLNLRGASWLAVWQLIFCASRRVQEIMGSS